MPVNEDIETTRRIMSRKGEMLAARLQRLEKFEEVTTKTAASMGCDRVSLPEVLDYVLESVALSTLHREDAKLAILGAFHLELERTVESLTGQTFKSVLDEGPER